MRTVLVISAMALLGLAADADAFHDGGVGSCQSCHVMHESSDGAPSEVSTHLVNGLSPSDLCLGCHVAVFGSGPLAPEPELGAGNFVFLLEDNINDHKSGTQQPIAGEAAGHSVVAPGAGLMPDSRWSSAPGGTFPAAELGCTSCHDPHGNTNFRMLYGAGDVQGGAHTFFAAAPTAAGVALGGSAESPTHHTAYRGGWARWCGNCHGYPYHGAGEGRFQHPDDIALGAEIAGRYNLYAGDLDPAGGAPATAYLPAVPFEDPSALVGSAEGPSATSRVTCLSCHRAHATSAPSAGRWDWSTETLGEDGAVSGSWPIPNPYPDPGQRSLCVKCHDVDHDNQKSCLNCHASGGGKSGGLLPAEP